MQNLLLNAFDDWAGSLGVGLSLVIGLAVVTVALLVAGIVLAVLRLIIFFNYWVARRTAASGATGQEAAAEALRLSDADDVKVEKAGFFRALFFGNYYDPKKNTVFLRRSTLRGCKISYLALAVQKAALVIQARENSAKFRTYWRLKRAAVFGPLFFLPIIAAGLILDCVVGFTGVPTLASSLIALAFFLAAAVLAGLTVSVEKRAARDAADLLAKTGLMTEEEQQKAAKVLKVYILSYITDFIIVILKIVQLILKIFIQFFALFLSKKK